MKKLTALLKPLEKLITEHGSAAIQTKHIALLKEQLTLAEKKIESFETENQNLKRIIKRQETEITDLRLKIDNCQKINKQIKQKISQKLPPKPRRSGWIWGH
ncbi:MAG: hypothetical protein FD156_1079 [Nitrospirae bacterium]|nr:MAG: hypothetical protein FD156_1079 [Nitrospirota bacterium]